MKKENRKNIEKPLPKFSPRRVTTTKRTFGGKRTFGNKKG